MAFTLEENRIYILAAVALILLAGTGWYIYRHMRKTRHQRHLQSVIASLGLPYIRDAVLPDGVDSLAFIDYLIQLPDGVIVLDVENSKGHLFGGKSVDQWSQVLNNRTYKFNNPLYANQSKCQAVIWNVANIRKQDQDDTSDWHTHGWVVFSNAGNFPKGIPDRVSMIDDLKENLAPLMNSELNISESIRKTWDALHNVSVNTRTELTR